MKINQWFAWKRAEKKLTMGEIAQRCGLHRSTIWKVEKGLPIKGKIMTKIVGAMRLTKQETSECHSLWAKQRLGIEDPVWMSQQIELPKGLNKEELRLVGRLLANKKALLESARKLR